MFKIVLLLAITTFSQLSMATAQRDVRNSQDHPLIGRYPGFMIKKYQQYEYDEVAIMAGKFDASKTTATILEIDAKVTNIIYDHKDLDPTVSGLQLYRNYETALKKLKADIILSCRGSDCIVNIPSNMPSSWSQLGQWIRASKKIMRGFGGESVVGSNDFSVLIGQVKQNKKISHIMIVTSVRQKQRMVAVSIVEPAELDTELVPTGSLGDIEIEIKKEGKVILDGIYFDHDKSNVKPESKQSMDIIASYLKSNPQSSFYVVGHTDSSGDYTHNLSLSEARAQSVIAYLAKNYKLDVSRLTPVGIGPVSPASSNDSPEGQMINRRVELVASESSIASAKSSASTLSGTYAPDLAKVTDPKIKAMAGSMPQFTFFEDGHFEVYMAGSLAATGEYAISKNDLTMTMQNSPQKAILSENNTRFFFSDGEKQGYVKIK